MQAYLCQCNCSNSYRFVCKAFTYKLRRRNPMPREFNVRIYVQCDPSKDIFFNSVFLIDHMWVLPFCHVIHLTFHHAKIYAWITFTNRKILLRKFTSHLKRKVTRRDSRAGTSSRKKTTSWCVLSADGIIRPYFFKNYAGESVIGNGRPNHTRITYYLMLEIDATSRKSHFTFWAVSLTAENIIFDF